MQKIPIRNEIPIAKYRSPQRASRMINKSRHCSRRSRYSNPGPTHINLDPPINVDAQNQTRSNAIFSSYNLNNQTPLESFVQSVYNNTINSRMNNIPGIKEEDIEFYQKSPPHHVEYF